MIRERVANLVPYFVPREVPERAATADESLDIHLAMRRVDSAYERFRNLLDPGDEDILRRKAIVRFLRRRWEFSSEPEPFAFALLKDLAYGRYIPENTHRRYADDVAVVVRKAFMLWQLGGRVAHRWLLPFVAVDIDRIIYPREGEDALVYAFFDDVWERLHWEDETIDAAERKTQIFLACHRALSKTDDAELFWHLLRATEPAWDSELSEENLRHLADVFPVLQEEIERTLRHPSAVRLLRRLQPPAVPYRILHDLLRRPDAEVVLGNRDTLAAATREALLERIRRLERQMFRRVWHAALFLFLSKGVLALALEIPYEVLLLGKLRVVPLIINLIFPPTVLTLMTGSVQRPGKANTERLVNILSVLISGEGERSGLVIRPTRRSVVRQGLFALTYGMFTLLLLGGVLWLLSVLHFSLVGGFFFIVFLGLVSFFGLRLRRLMRDIRVVAPREGVLSSLLDFLTLPLVDLGRQIALHASQINVFLFLLDAVIEAPFKVLVGIVEEWFAFIREKKEELV